MQMNRDSRWKKRVLCLSVIAVIIAIFATGTAAYFIVEETSYNVITTGILAMDLVEKTSDGRPWPDEPMYDVYPGHSADRSVYVKNVGVVPFFTRITMEYDITPAPGVTAELNGEYVGYNIDLENWIAYDGYYYYRYAVQPGEQTTPLFSEVSFVPEMTNEYMDAVVEINVVAQAVQSDNNGPSPLDALGWNEPADVATRRTGDAPLHND